MNELDNILKSYENIIKYCSDKKAEILIKGNDIREVLKPIEDVMERTQSKLYLCRAFHELANNGGVINIGKYFVIRFDIETGSIYFDINNDIKPNVPKKLSMLINNNWINGYLFNTMSKTYLTTGGNEAYVLSDLITDLNYKCYNINNMEAEELTKDNYKYVNDIIHDYNHAINKLIGTRDILYILDQTFFRMMAGDVSE